MLKETFNLRSGFVPVLVWFDSGKLNFCKIQCFLTKTALKQHSNPPRTNPDQNQTKTGTKHDQGVFENTAKKKEEKNDSF
jgi:hypothetical protein